MDLISKAHHELSSGQSISLKEGWPSGLQQDANLGRHECAQ
jgi:hypothetical protein